MGKSVIIYYLLLVIAERAIGTPEDDARCCPQGQYAIRKKIEPHLCWDPISNVTGFINLSCNGSTMMGARPNFILNDAGQLVIKLDNLDIEFEPGAFCMANATSMTDTNLTKVKRAVVICDDKQEKIIDESVYGYILVVSAVFLALTAIIYISLPELRDLQGKSIINFCISLGLGLTILTIMKLMSYSDMNLCAVRGFLVYFFVIASFFWTNAISIQIFMNMKRPTTSNYGWKEFIWYAVYAWGCPAVLTIAMAIVNFIPGDHKKPGIGLNHCWFFNKKLQWQYMYSIMSILICINICIFIYTSVILWRHSFSSNHIKALRYKFVMTTRLFVVMGVAWIFEMIGSLVKSHIILEILDIINSLQGVLIFLVLVVFRRRTIKMMHRHGWLDCISGRVEKWLAVGDDEEEVVQHTMGVSMDDQKIYNN